MTKFHDVEQHLGFPRIVDRRDVIEAIAGERGRPETDTPEQCAAKGKGEEREAGPHGRHLSGSEKPMPPLVRTLQRLVSTNSSDIGVLECLRATSLMTLSRDSEGASPIDEHGEHDDDGDE